MTLFVLKTINSLIKLLNSERAPSQLAAGIAFGMLVGLTPFFSLHNLILFFVVCLFRVNFSMFFVSLGIFKVLAFLFDPLFNKLGYWLLVDQTSLREFWISITSGPLLPYFRFNNTIVMGSLAVGLMLWLPVFIGSILLIKQYRSKWKERVANSKFMKAMKATPIYGIYVKYNSWSEKLSVIQ